MVVEREIEAGFELVQILVSRMEDVAGRHDVVADEQADRDRGSERRGPSSPLPRAAAPHEDEERRRERDREPRGACQPEQEAGKELARIGKHGGQRQTAIRGHGGARLLRPAVRVGRRPFVVEVVFAPSGIAVPADRDPDGRQG